MNLDAVVAEEVETRPEAGSAILQVHEGFDQTDVPRSKARVLVGDDGTTVYSASFVQVHMQSGLNRFYIVQLLSISGGTSRPYMLFCHWGKVGVPWYDEVDVWGSKKNYNTYSFTSKTEAIEKFEAWYLKKGGNSWTERRRFRQKPDMYGIVKLSRVNTDSKKKAKGGKHALSSSSSSSSSSSNFRGAKRHRARWRPRWRASWGCCSMRTPSSTPCAQRAWTRRTCPSAA